MMRIQERSSAKSYIYRGALAGAVFAVIFMQLSRWVGDLGYNRAALVYGVFVALFAYAGARLGAIFYNRLCEKECLNFQQHSKATTDAAENEERRRIANERMLALHANTKH